MRVHIHTYIHAYIYIYIYMYIFTHTIYTFKVTKCSKLQQNIY